MREVTQEEAAEMRRALKEIASYYSDAREHDRAWQARKLARESLNGSTCTSRPSRRGTEVTKVG